MNIGIHGNLGEGKTLAIPFLVRRNLWYAAQRGIEIDVLANILLRGVRNYRRIEARELYEGTLFGEQIARPNSIVAVDQIDNAVDTTRFMSRENKYMTSFADQARKRNITFVYTSSTSFKNDWRLGNVTQLSYKASKYDAADGERCSDTTIEHSRKYPHFFVYTAFNTRQGTRASEHDFTISATDARILYHYYQTDELYSKAEAYTTRTLANELYAMSDRTPEEIEAIIAERQKKARPEEMDGEMKKSLASQLFPELGSLDRYIVLKDSETIALTQHVDTQVYMRIKQVLLKHGFEYQSSKGAFKRLAEIEKASEGTPKGSDTVNWTKEILNA